MSSTTTPKSGYKTTLTHLLNPETHQFLSLPTSPLPLLIPQTQTQTQTAHLPPSAPTPIASLTLHPTLEAALHILNRDLPSAHFLLRHSQAAPAWESMYLHGMLHRVEGDVDNARAWYGDVEGHDVLERVWKDDGRDDGVPSGGWRGFLDRVERFRDGRMRNRKSSRSGGLKDEERDGDGREIDWGVEEAELNRISLWELKGVLGVCEERFGTGEVVDATEVYTMNGDHHGDQAAKMITGGEGWRVF